MSCAKMAQPIEMPFGIRTRVGPRKHVLDGSAHWRHLTNMTEPSMCGSDAVFLSNYFNHLLLGRVAVQRTQTQPIVTDQVVWSVSRSDTVVRHAKTAELIEMPFGLRTRVDPRKSVLDGGPDPPWKEVILRSEGAAHYEVYGHSALSCAKMAELIEMPFGIWTPVGPRNHISHGVQIPMRRGNFQGEGHARRHSAMGCVQTDKPYRHAVWLMGLGGIKEP